MAFVQEMVGLMGLPSGKSLGIMGAASPAKKEGGISHLHGEAHRVDRRVAGDLLCLTPTRPELSYVPKELSRALQPPTNDDYAKLRHVIRCLKGTEGYRLSIRPEATTTTDARFDVTTYVNSEWAECDTTGVSTPGCTITVECVAIHHYARTQTTVALLSDEAELHALISGTAETMGVLQLLRGCDVKTNRSATRTTDSTGGKSMASRQSTSSCGLSSSRTYWRQAWFGYARSPPRTT